MSIPQKQVEAILHYARTRQPGSEGGVAKFLDQAEQERQAGDETAHFALWFAALCFEAGRVFQAHNPRLTLDNFQDYDPGGPAEIGG